MVVAALGSVLEHGDVGQGPIRIAHAHDTVVPRDTVDRSIGGGYNVFHATQLRRSFEGQVRSGALAEVHHADASSQGGDDEVMGIEQREGLVPFLLPGTLCAGVNPEGFEVVRSCACAKGIAVSACP